jgi:Spy/CpxP family protein refolding chaperone
MKKTLGTYHRKLVVTAHTFGELPMNRSFKAYVLAGLIALPAAFAQSQLVLAATPEQHPRKLLHDVLTPKQRTQVEKMVVQSNRRSKPLLDKLKAFTDAHPKDSKLDDKAKAEFEGIVSKLRAERAATSNKIIALLTPQQKAKLEAAAKKIAKK